METVRLRMVCPLTFRHEHGSYLQGMETPLPIEALEKLSAVHGSYLQGMETKRVLFIVEYREDIVARILPTRNGNWFPKSAHLSGLGGKHGSYLQGMETGIPFPCRG